ncbi:hypothetical protein NQD34_000744 [Periophthalmus magnuspinnatus]|nr:hypothetical protein NQD34_000744 [Periophthalmus magnuspinnatus]
MSLIVHELRGLVMERLAVAADEIFALFERMCARYEEELLRSKLLQQPRDVIYREEIQSLNVIVGVDVCSDQVIKEELMNVKQEVDPPSNLDCPSPTLKSEKSDPAKEQEREVANVTREQCDGEGLGCSANLSLDNNRRFYNSSDTDDSADWAEGTSKRNGEEPNASLKKKPAEKHINMFNGVNSFCRNVVMRNVDIPLDQTLRCPKCYRSFKSMETLARHAQMHTRKKQIICQICNKGYSSRSNFSKHFRIHSAKNNFRCSLCNHVFAERWHFEEHMTIHTGERPFSCSHCGQRFRHRNSIKRHVLSWHSKEKPYSCPICQKGFVEKKHFNTHIRKYHSEPI